QNPGIPSRAQSPRGGRSSPMPSPNTSNGFLNRSCGTISGGHLVRGNMAKFRSKPASQTDEGRERFGAYWLALGEFAHLFSRVEMFMHFVFRWHTKTSVDIARAVFSGVWIDTASQFLGRLATNGNITPEE